MQIFQMFSYFTYKISEKNAFVNITTNFIIKVFKGWKSVKLPVTDTGFPKILIVIWKLKFYHWQQIQLASCICGFYICAFNQQQIENIQKKNFSRKFQEYNSNSPCSNNNLHSIYIAFTTIYIAFVGLPW